MKYVLYVGYIFVSVNFYWYVSEQKLRSFSHTVVWQHRDVTHYRSDAVSKSIETTTDSEISGKTRQRARIISSSSDEDEDEPMVEQVNIVLEYHLFTVIDGWVVMPLSIRICFVCYWHFSRCREQTLWHTFLYVRLLVWVFKLYVLVSKVSRRWR